MSTRPQIVRARALRRTQFPPERRLWLFLKTLRPQGHHFRRQSPFRTYILDFVCMERRLIVEADGSQHAESPRDVERDLWLRAAGFRVRRFWNADILLRAREVGDTIWADLEANRFVGE